MAISAEQLNIILAAKDREFAKAMAANSRRIQKFESDAKKNLSGVSQGFDFLGSAASRLGLTMSVGALATGMMHAIKSAIDVGAQISNLARIAGTGTTEFQKFAIAAQTVGIDQSKLADILKDVNDKFGDYMSTGAGPLADFFDNIAPKVGLTKEAFIGLSSDQALGKYVKALQDAGVNQQEMTFYMEALASDATVLNPLLADNARVLTSIGDSAEKTGRILDESMIANAKAMETRWTEVLGVMTTHWNNFWLTVAMGIDELFDISTEAQLGTAMQEVDRQIGALQQAQKDFEPFTDPQYKADYAESYGMEEFARAQAEAQAALDATTASYEAAVQAANDLKTAMDTDVTNLPPIIVNDPGAGTSTTPSAGAGQTDPKQKAKEAYDSLMGSIDNTKRATNEFGAAQKVVNDALALGVITQDQATATLAVLSARLKTATGEMVDLSSVASLMESGMTNAFMSILDGTQSAKDAFKSMAADIIKELYRVLIVQQLVGSIGSSTKAGSGILGSIGNAFPSLKSNASGGALYAGQPSVVGEHGRELFVPSSAGRVLSVPQAKAAVSGGDGVTVVQNINISTGVQQTVRNEIKSMMPQIADNAKAAVLDARRRGGSYGSAFA
jgi:hypothetical protein